jgi:hypothetical protein
VNCRPVNCKPETTQPRILPISMVTIGSMTPLTIVALHSCIVILLSVRRHCCLLLASLRLLLVDIPSTHSLFVLICFLASTFYLHSSTLHNGLVPCIIVLSRHLSPLEMSRRSQFLYARSMDIDSTHAQSVEPNYIETAAEIRYQTNPHKSLLFVNHKY